ncbi:MAG: glycosyltransferase family 4 protein [Gammaproteobacteria bacterium]|nr:glycosyltransferase family 4 protein [Gammaproteobacteria bacterium]
MKILSPVPRGSGVEVLHRSLMQGIDGYVMRTYSPWWTLLPAALPAFSARDADLVHASADYGWWFHRRGVPLVVTLHNYTSDQAMRPFSSRLQYVHYRSDLRWFHRATLRVATVVVAISRFIGEIATRDLGVTPHLRLIYNGVDHQRFVPAGQARGARPFRVLFCGNLNRRKRAHLLPALAEHLGTGFEIHYTSGLSGAAQAGWRPATGGARLHALGSVPHAEMPAVYQSMDALFMPSVREGFGLCVAEAMACGLPVVACAQSALPELVTQDRGGLLCAVDDVAGYAAALRRLADDAALCRDMGGYNRQRVERLFTRDRMVGEYRRLFEEVLDGGFN